MFSKVLSTAALALAASSLASAQTFTSCNPLKKTCPNDPAVGDSTVTVDFTKGASDFFTLADGTNLEYDNALGAVFSIKNENQAPTITSSKYIMFGKVDVVLRASSGVGVVTSVVLQSDDLDEIDWEWLGGDAFHVQTNYFSKGNTSTYDRGGMSEVSNPQDDYHTYTVEWTQDHVQWIIDGAVVRTLTPATSEGFPQTPMQLKLGTWVAGGANAPEGTVQWAGGHTDFSKAPFLGYYKSVTITDYSKGIKGAKEYSYSDNSGTYESIDVLTTSGGSSSGSSSSSSSSAPASSSTKASSSSSSKAASTSSAASSKASSTFATVTSSSTASGTGAATTASADPTGTAEQTVTSTASAVAVETSGSSTGATATPSTVGTSAGFKSGINAVAVMGAAAFAAYFAL